MFLKKDKNILRKYVTMIKVDDLDLEALLFSDSHDVLKFCQFLRSKVTDLTRDHTLHSVFCLRGAGL